MQSMLRSMILVDLTDQTNKSFENENSSDHANVHFEPSNLEHRAIEISMW